MTKKRATSTPKAPRKKRVVFTLEAPEAQRVLVTGTFCDWQTDSCVLKKDRKGTWKATLSLPPGRHEYRFLVDGEWRDDPNCAERVTNPFGTENCILHLVRETAQAAHSAAAGEQTP
jgi:1,4-alpha-glucan branching enzyme